MITHWYFACYVCGYKISDHKDWEIRSHALFLNTLRPRQNGRHFADDTFKRIFVNENVRILIEISLKFVPKDSINNILALVQIMASRRPGDKPLSEPMMVCLPMHTCVTRPQWVNFLRGCDIFTKSWLQMAQHHISRCFSCIRYACLKPRINYWPIGRVHQYLDFQISSFNKPRAFRLL